MVIVGILIVWAIVLYVHHRQAKRYERTKQQRRRR